MEMNDKEMKKNGEGYKDPTAYKAMRYAEADRDRHAKTVGCILRICELAGFYMENRIVLRDKRTGKVWD